MSKRTPWSLFIVPEHTYPNGERSPSRIYINDALGKRLWHNVVFMDYQEDDARLVAAAPELLETCKSLVGMIEGWVNNPTERLEAAKAVIAKANPPV